VVMGALASFLFLVTASECRSIRYLRFASRVDQVPKVNRAGFVGGSNFQIGWSRYEQNDEQILP